MNAASKINLKFPKNSGFDKTEITIYGGEANLVKLFYGHDAKKTRVLFVTDTNVASLECMKSFISHVEKQDKDKLLILQSGESYKTMDSVLAIVKKALDCNFNRNCMFVGIGGGVITDMTAFAASIFKRGVDVEFVPTTLLCDVDASIGGKTGCDFDTYKNMTGTFYPAKKIHMFPSFIKTLPEKEYISGLSEAIKTAFLFNEKLVGIFREKKELIMKRDEGLLMTIIAECAREKCRIVHKDFREKNMRAFLNYGHTFGHAAESILGLGKITHGEGVAWGMGRALELSKKLSLCTEEFSGKCMEILDSYGYRTTALDENLKEKLIEAMHKDKKNNSSKTRVILQAKKQKTIIREVSDEDLRNVL